MWAQLNVGLITRQAEHGSTGLIKARVTQTAAQSRVLSRSFTRRSWILEHDVIEDFGTTDDGPRRTE